MKHRLQFYRDKDRQWRWRLKASNGKVVADSGEGYKRRIDCESGLRSAALGLAIAALSKEGK